MRQIAQSRPRACSREITSRCATRGIAFPSPTQAISPHRSFYLREEATREGEYMPQPQQPQWQPISMLQTITRHIDGMLQEAERQQDHVRQAQRKPWVLDDYTVKRVMEVFTVQKNNLWLFDTQIECWQAGTLTDEQRK